MAPRSGTAAETGLSPESAAAPQSVGDTTAATMDRERIAQRAYELYLQRGGTDGSALTDWLEAERELRESREPGEDER